MNRPRDCLEGATLEQGWTVVKRLAKSQTDTGSNFSTGYIVEDSQRRQFFLKAIDFSDALQAADPARELQELTEEFNLERDVLQIGKRLSCVVTAVADGTKIVKAAGSDHTVQYIVFELAEDSLRRLVASAARLPMGTALLALRRVATGLRQLHQNHVAHQDTKPSNVLRFGEEGFKIADLGRASIKGRVVPHDVLAVAGDPQYSPPELLYGHADPEFSVRRLACDAYMLGGLATFLVTQVSMTALIINSLDTTAHPIQWRGSYGQVLPQVRQAFGKALVHIEGCLPPGAPYTDELVTCISQLCEPDPTLRGHPATRATQSKGGNVYDLERYLSIFDRLSVLAKRHERRSSPS